MADLTNRSRYRVSVKNRDDLTAYFPFNKFKAVEAHVEELKGQGYKHHLGATLRPPLHEPRAAQTPQEVLVASRLTPPSQPSCKPSVRTTDVHLEPSRWQTTLF